MCKGLTADNARINIYDPKVPHALPKHTVIAMWLDLSMESQSDHVHSYSDSRVKYLPCFVRVRLSTCAQPARRRSYCALGMSSVQQ